MPERFAPEKIGSILKKYYPFKTLVIDQIPTGKFNTTFDITLDDKESLILRIAPPPNAGFIFYERNMMAQEPGLHKMVKEKTSIPVPVIYQYDTAHDCIDRDFLIMEKLPGFALTQARGLSYARYDGVLEQVGRYLAQLHLITAGQYGYRGEHKPLPVQKDWCRAFGLMWIRMVDNIHEVGGYTGQEANRMKQLFRKHEGIFKRPVPASLCHMDIWHQNILVDDQDRVTGIVDWDRALWGDVEIEFAVLDYCGISEPAFWKGYGRQRDNSPSAQLRREFYLLYEVQKYIIINLTRRHDPAAAQEYKQQVFQLARPL